MSGQAATPGSEETEGQALIEFALVVPVLLLLLFAVVNFGLAYGESNALSFAASRGAGQAMVSAHAPPDATDYAVITDTIRQSLNAPRDPASVVSSTVVDSGGSAITV